MKDFHRFNTPEYIVSTTFTAYKISKKKDSENEVSRQDPLKELVRVHSSGLNKTNGSLMPALSSGLCVMKRLGVLLLPLDGILGHHRVPNMKRLGASLLPLDGVLVHHRVPSLKRLGELLLPMDAMLFQHRVASMFVPIHAGSPAPIYTPAWMGRLVEKTSIPVLSCTWEYPWGGLERGEGVLSDINASYCKKLHSSLIRNYYVNVCDWLTGCCLGKCVGRG